MGMTCQRPEIPITLSVPLKQKIQNIYFISEIKQKIATILLFRVGTANFFMKLPMVLAETMLLLELEIISIEMLSITKNARNALIFLAAKAYAKNNTAF